MLLLCVHGDRCNLSAVHEKEAFFDKSCIAFVAFLSCFTPASSCQCEVCFIVYEQCHERLLKI